MAFLDKLLTASRRQQSLLCLGLDPEPSRLPIDLRRQPLSQAIVTFCQRIIEASVGSVCAIKPNSAFFERLGIEGTSILQEVLKAVPVDLPIILDAKRGDLGNSARGYAATAFDILGCDAVTVNPYMGYDSVEPFLEYQDRGVILLCRTSNPSARDFQDLEVKDGQGVTRPLYEFVAQRVQAWNTYGNCGLVVGATYPEELRSIRVICPDLPILIPGVGAQGGDLESAVVAGTDTHRERAIISVSRGILFASEGEDYAQAAGQAAVKLKKQINQALNQTKA